MYSAACHNANPTHRHDRLARERRPLVGTAARRAAAAQTPTLRMTPLSARTPQGKDGARQRKPRTADCEEARGRLGALASSPGGGLRPASRGSAKPAPMTLTATAARKAARPRTAIGEKARGRPGNAEPLAGTAARRAAAAQIPNRQDDAPLRRVPRPEGRMARDSGPPPGELAISPRESQADSRANVALRHPGSAG